MELLEALNWRYAAKKMSGKIVDEDKVEAIIEAARLAPSSNGLHPYKILLITNQELKQKIQPVAHNQSQVVTCSHLLVFAGLANYTEEHIDNITAYSLEQRGKPEGYNPNHSNVLKNRFLKNDPEYNFEHISKQVYLACGLAIAAAAELYVDSTPMEGFEPEALDELLQLENLGLKSVLMLALGYRDEETDFMSRWNKVRTPYNDFVIEIK